MAEILAEIYSWISFVPKITFKNLIEIAIIAILVYEMLIWIKNTRAWTLLKGIVFILAFFLAAAILELDTILWLLEKTSYIAVTAIIVIFQPELRKALEQMWRYLLLDVQRKIGGSGKVAGWQAPHMGTKGGYVAVRAKADTYQTTKSGKRYAVGYVTNAIEGGHRHGGPRGGKGYRPRYRKAAVPGKWFYQAVRQDVDEMGQEEVDALMELIVRGLEGLL